MSKFVQWLRSVDRGLDRMELFPAYRLRDLRHRMEAQRREAAVERRDRVPVAISTREEARRLYAQTLREMNPDPELTSRIDRYSRERSTAATERRDPVADLGSG